MPYVLQTLPKDEEQAELQCYVTLDGVAATAFGAPVLQHCMLMNERHWAHWEPTGQFYEIVADPQTGAPARRWGREPPTQLKTYLLERKAFVDLEGFTGEYLPYYAIRHGLAAAFDQPLRNTRESKLIALYFLDAGALRTRVCQVRSRGFGMGDLGAARTDPAAEIEYLWWGHLAFGYSLGLDLWRHAPGWIPAWSAPSFVYGGRTYHRVSEPGATPSGATSPLYPTVPEVALYKAFKGEADGLYPSEANVSDDPRKRKKRNRPYQPCAPRIHALRLRDQTSPGAYKTQVAKKRKGRAFTGAGEAQMEVDGSDVRARGIVLSKSGTGRDATPATPTQRANKLVENVAVATALRERGVTLEMHRLRTDQEWCHLLAASLTGLEEDYNFVLGSRHCNSEQLAIETALLFSMDAVHERGATLRAKISAYLVPGTTMLADVIRYKVLLSDRLILDHLIDAQSESLSYLEYRILLETVRRVVAVALGGEAIETYETRVNKRIADRLRGERGAPDPDITPYYVDPYLRRAIR